MCVTVREWKHDAADKEGYVIEPLHMSSNGEATAELGY